MKKIIALVLSFVFLMCLNGCSTASASIGIIGGADGPTAVFVTSKVNWPYVCSLIGVIAVTVLVIFIIRRNKKK